MRCNQLLGDIVKVKTPTQKPGANMALFLVATTSAAPMCV